nr:MAG TPA: hypothetical protein [Bacteriophage sp.]
MKIKNRDLLRKYVLYERGIWEKPRNFPLLLDMAKRRIGWRNDVLHCCYNYKDIASSDSKVSLEYCNPKKFHFPKKWRIDPDVFDPAWSLPYKYRVVRKKNNRYKVVLNKYKPFPTRGRTLVVDHKRGYIREIGDKVWYHPVWMDFGCDTCADLGTCLNGRHDKSFCTVAAKCGICYGNTWQEVRQ